MKRLQCVVLVVLSVMTHFAKANMEVVLSDSNWKTKRYTSDADPFTKKSGSSACEISDSNNLFSITMLSDPSEDLVYFTFRPKNLMGIIEGDIGDLLKARYRLSSAKPNTHGQGGLYSHTKLTHTSGKGEVYTQNYNLSSKTTPKEYPYELSTSQMTFPQNEGEEYHFENFCQYIVSRHGSSELFGCKGIDFKLSKKAIKQMENEAKTLKSDSFTLRTTIYASLFLNDNYGNFPSDYVRRNTYNFPIKIVGLSNHIDNYHACRKQAN